MSLNTKDCIIISDGMGTRKIIRKEYLLTMVNKYQEMSHFLRENSNHSEEEIFRKCTLKVEPWIKKPEEKDNRKELNIDTEHQKIIKAMAHDLCRAVDECSSIGGKEKEEIKEIIKTYISKEERTSKAERLITGLKDKGWTAEEINDFIIWIENEN